MSQVTEETRSMRNRKDALAARLILFAVLPARLTNAGSPWDL